MRHLVREGRGGGDSSAGIRGRAFGNHDSGQRADGRLNVVPTATVPLDGGASISSSSLQVNLGSSYPGATSWNVVVNNGSRFSATFQVWVVCSTPPSGYVQASYAASLSPTSSVFFLSNCPGGTITGGGAMVTSADVGVAIYTDTPVPGGSNAWETGVRNAGSSNVSLQTYAVCGDYPASSGWVEEQGASQTSSSGSQTPVDESCPPGLVVLGGGVWGVRGSDAQTTGVNSTYPSSDSEWSAVENNGSSSDQSLMPVAVCAGSEPNGTLGETPETWALAMAGGGMVAFFSLVRRRHRLA